VEKLQVPLYLGSTTATNQNCIRSDIKGRLNSRNDWCYSTQNTLSFRIPYKNTEMNI